MFHEVGSWISTVNLLLDKLNTDRFDVRHVDDGISENDDWSGEVSTAAQ